MMRNISERRRTLYSKSYLHGILLSLAALSFYSDSYAVEISSIADGAWVALQPFDNRFNDTNSLIVEGPDAVVVIDAQTGTDDVNQIIAFIDDEIGKPVAYLINTHWHADHTQGNSLYVDRYGDQLQIIGQTTQADDIFERADVDLKARVASLKEQLPGAREQLVSGVKTDGTPFTPEELSAQTARVERAEAWVTANESAIFIGPTILVDAPLAIDDGAGHFTVYPLRGHTRGDLIIHFPDAHVVATGDLVDAMPYAGHGYPAEWLATLDEITALEADFYVPGHGSVLTDVGLINNLSTYFESLTMQVRQLEKEGLSAEEIQEAIDLSVSRTTLAGDDAAAMRFFDAVQAEAIQAAMDELDTN